ncbi:MAG: hypothetical protein JRH11_06985 [Deltaproteobacteria bacterium]|nr:hypothetical protein [Deltaproteobacteria bacterium]
MVDRAQRPPYLIVEPDPTLARQLTLKLGRHAPTIVASTVAEAKILIDERDRWSGIITELRLPDGSGLDLIDRMRQPQPKLCAMVLSSLHDPSLLGDYAADGSTLLTTKPPPGGALSAFLVETLGINRPISNLPPPTSQAPSMPSVPPREENRGLYEARVDAVRREAKRAGLSDEETRILGLMVEGRSPDEAIAAVKLEPAAWDSRVASILQKTGAHNMGQLALRIVKESMALAH